MIGVLGTSHRCADLSTREAIAKALGTCDENLRKGSVFLLTCNRAEWYFCTSTPAKTHQEMVASIREAVGHDALCHLYTFFGLECFHHLGKVVSGLDSLFVGETEIQGQVKAAYDAARESKSLPKELFDAAAIDGCSTFGMLRQIVLPLSKPVIATASVFSLIGSWNSFMWPLVMTSKPELRLLQVGLSYFNAEASAQTTLLMAASAFSILPILLLFFLAQKQIIESTAKTGLKD